MVAINGFTVTDNRAAIGIKSFTVPGTSVVLPVRADVAPLLIGAAAEFHRTVEPLHPGWCWGYAYRLVRGGTTPSFHSAGIAIDLNAPAHPLGTDPRANYSAKQIELCRQIAHKYGLRWGGDYTGRKDGMHFEVILSQPQALALVRRLQTPPKPAPAPAPKPAPASSHKPGSRTIRQGDLGPDVAFVQRFIGPARAGVADGIFGARTTTAVRWYQQMRGLPVDGIVGPKTWAVLLSK